MGSGGQERGRRALLRQRPVSAAGGHALSHDVPQQSDLLQPHGPQQAVELDTASKLLQHVRADAYKLAVLLHALCILCWCKHCAAGTICMGGVPMPV